MIRRTRSNSFVLSATAAAVTLSACSEGPTGPQSSEAFAPLFTHAVAAPAASCADIAAAQPLATDGEYVIVPSTGPAAGGLVNVYCADMAGSPQEYITLASTGAGKNFSSTSSHTPLRTTSFTRLRLDVATLLVDIGDVAFSSTVTADPFWAARPVAFATASHCSGGGRESANIDLTGTDFSVNAGFLISGWYSHGSVNGTEVSNIAGGSQVVHAQTQNVDLTGGGFCGGVSTGDFHLGIFLYDGHQPTPLQLQFDGALVSFTSLCALVGEVVSNPDVVSGLCDKLQAAEASAARGNTKAKTNQLKAFGNQVEAQRGKSITDAHADLLLSLASLL